MVILEFSTLKLVNIWILRPQRSEHLQKLV